MAYVSWCIQRLSLSTFVCAQQKLKWTAAKVPEPALNLQSQVLNEHTAYTILGKPFPLSQLGPAPKPDEMDRVATVKAVLATNTEADPVIGGNSWSGKSSIDAADTSLVLGVCGGWRWRTRQVEQHLLYWRQRKRGWA